MMGNDVDNDRTRKKEKILFEQENFDHESVFS